MCRIAGNKKMDVYTSVQCKIGVQLLSYFDFVIYHGREFEKYILYKYIYFLLEVRPERTRRVPHDATQRLP